MARELLFGWDETFRYFECAACGCLQLDQMVDDPGRFYGGSYGTASSSRLKQHLRTILYRISFSPFESVAKALCALTPGCNYGLMRTLRPMAKDVALLDVGSGSGRLLHSLRQLGFSGRLVGVDPFLSADTVCADGVELRKSNLAELFGGQRFDVITMMHALEHIADQDGTMETASRLLQPGGVCVVTIPIANSEQWKRYGSAWVQMDPPRHVFLHTARSLSILAARHGLTIAQVIQESSSFQFWGTALARRRIPLCPMSRAYIRSLWRMPFDMVRAARANARGTGDTATFLLRHRASEQTEGNY